MDAFGADTQRLLRSILDETWECLRPEERARTSKTQICTRILEMAKMGERDPVRLRIEAVAGVVTSPL
jgi:hypothetical protein